MDVRLDKWLQVARVFKTRTRATQACSAGRVQINGQPAKARRLVKIGDRIEIRFKGWSRILVVARLRDRPLPKKLVSGIYEDLSPPRPRIDPVEKLLREIEGREPGAGRPTKKERRDLEKLRRRPKH